MQAAATLRVWGGRNRPWSRMQVCNPKGRQPARAARRTRQRHEQKWHRSSGFAFCCRRASGPAARQCRVWRETLGRIGGKGNSSKGLGRGRGELWGVVPGNRARQEAWYNCLGLAPASQVLKILQAPRSDQELALPRAIATCGGVARLAESAAHACG